MSDDNVNLQEPEENPVEAILEGAETTEQAAAEPVEESTQDSAEGTTEEVDLIDVSTLGGSQAHDEERKKHNDAFAKKRIELKRAKERLKQNQFTGSVDGAVKPKRTDYLREDVLYDKYGGSEALAMAAWQDDLDDYNDKLNASVNSQREQTQGNVQMLEEIQAAEEQFAVHAEKIAPRVQGFDEKLEAAERALGYDAVAAIKAKYPENAPLMLATLGANRNLSNRISSLLGSPDVLIELTRLEQNVQKALTPAKTLSTAPSETAVVGSSGNGQSIEALIEAAENAGDWQESMRLKKQAGLW